MWLMDIGILSMIMSQTRVKESAGITVIKMAMNIDKENATKCVLQWINYSSERLLKIENWSNHSN